MAILDRTVKQAKNLINDGEDVIDTVKGWLP
jgi:hypothetical protein